MIISPQNQAVFARFFSASVIREIAMTGSFSTFARLAKESGLATKLDPRLPISSVFEEIFAYSKSADCRHEYIYKSAIADKILLGVHNLNTASMLVEMRANNCRADVVVLNGTSTAYEIKSERDNLIKLENQVSAYRSVFARVNVIAASKHVTEILKRVPSDVGVQILSNRYQISTIREAKTTPERVSPDCVFESLRIVELKEIALQLGVEIPNVPNTRMHTSLKKLFSNLDPVEVHSQMVQVLKRTRNLSRLSAFVDSLPKSLRTAALTIRLNGKDQIKLVDSMQTKFGDALKWSQ